MIARSDMNLNQKSSLDCLQPQITQIQTTRKNQQLGIILEVSLQVIQIYIT